MTWRAPRFCSTRAARGRRDVDYIDPAEHRRLDFVWREKGDLAQQAVRQGLGGRGVENHLGASPATYGGGRPDGCKRRFQLEQKHPRPGNQTAGGGDVAG